MKAKRVCLSRYGNQLVMTPAYFNKQRSTMSNILDQHRPPEELVKQWHSHLGGTILVKVIYSIGRVGSLAYISLASFLGHKGNLGSRLICFWDVLLMFPLGIGPRAHGLGLSHQCSDHWAMTTRQPPALLYILYRWFCHTPAATSPSLYTVQVVLSHTWQALSIIMLSDS